MENISSYQYYLIYYYEVAIISGKVVMSFLSHKVQYAHEYF